MFHLTPKNFVLITCFTFVSFVGLSVGATNAADWRIEGGVGYTQGNNSASAIQTSGGGGSTFTSSGDGLGSGGGLAANAGLWVDAPFAWAGSNWFADNISLGGQYLYLGNSVSAKGIVTGTSNDSANFDLNLSFNALLFNAALRYNKGFLHPYFGAGVGGAYGKAGFTFNTAGTDVNRSSVARSAKFPTTVGQVFAGYDYDITSALYVGVSGTFFFTGTYVNELLVPAAAKVTAHQMAAMAHFGLKL